MNTSFYIFTVEFNEYFRRMHYTLTHLIKFGIITIFLYLFSILLWLLYSSTKNALINIAKLVVRNKLVQ